MPMHASIFFSLLLILIKVAGSAGACPAADRAGGRNTHWIRARKDPNLMFKEINKTKHQCSNLLNISQD